MKYQDQAKDNDKLILLSGDVHHLSWWRISWWCRKIDSYEKYDVPYWASSQYELWDMECLFQSHDYAPFLKMKNPTTSVWHVEGVSPACRNLHEAIKERFGGRDFIIEAMA